MKDKNKDLAKFATSFVYILLGLALIVWTNQIESMICMILAAAAIICGLAKLIGYSVAKVETRIANDTNGFAVGLALIILGIFIWFKGTMIIAVIPFVIGFMITYKGLEGIQNVLNFKKFGYGVQKGVLIGSAVITVFGILVMMNPFSTAKVLFMMLGIGLLVSGLADFVSDIIFTRKMKQVEKAGGAVVSNADSAAESTEL